MEIPDADIFVSPRKKGILAKLTGKSWLYSGCWKTRYCVLDGTKLYYYENEKSKGSDKASGVISLDYYDVCEQYQDKKHPYVFIIGTSVRGFFDNRHQFAAETESDMQGWIRSVHDGINDARSVRSRAGRNRTGSGNNETTENNAQMDDAFTNEDLTNGETSSGQLVNATKDRVRGPQGRRLPQRRSMMPTGTPTEEFNNKQRSFSLSSPNEHDEDTQLTNSDNRRISLSMDAVDKEDTNSTDAMSNQRSSSNYEISSHDTYHNGLQNGENGVPPKLIKKPMFGKLGGQHAALTKELEFKLKSGLAPGGRRFYAEEVSENGSTNINDVEIKLEALSSKLGSVRTDISGLEEKVREIKSSTRSVAQQSQSAQSQIQDLLSQATAILKEAQDTNVECKLALAQAQEARDEHQKLLQECQSTLGNMKALSTSSSSPMQEAHPNS